MANIVLINGHPDPSKDHLCDALSSAYADGARSSGHDITVFDLGALEFPCLRSRGQWEGGIEATPESLRPLQAAAMAADHIVIIYPLWLGTMPAYLKAMFEQAFRMGVAFEYRSDGWPKALFRGKSARIIVTMGMPAWMYRWYYFAHSLKNLERNILGFVGVSPIRTTLLGGVETASAERREKWIDDLRNLGAKAR